LDDCDPLTFDRPSPVQRQERMRQIMHGGEAIFCGSDAVGAGASRGGVFDCSSFLEIDTVHLVRVDREENPFTFTAGMTVGADDGSSDGPHRRHPQLASCSRSGGAMHSIVEAEQ
jgi:hypothetical protein